MFRKCYEVIGYAKDGEVYCINCFNSNEEEASPIFLGDEEISNYYCNNCHQKLDE